MQTLPNKQSLETGGAPETAAQRSTRLLPGPFSVQEQVAMASAISAPVTKPSINKARIAFGTAAVAVAFAMPELSAGAMDSPYLRLEMSEPSLGVDQPVWSPFAAATAPVYSSAIAAERIAPTSLTFGTAERFVGSGTMLPLDFLESGSERFDLAFAGVAMPSPAEFTISSALPPQGRSAIASASPDLAAPLRASLIDIPQITNVRSFASATPAEVSRAQMGQGQTGGAQAGSAVRTGSNVERSVAAANESVAAAFAGALDVSGGVRDSLPISGPNAETAAGPAASDAAEFVSAVPLPTAPAGLDASRAAEAELVTRTRLDARINGVVTGSVDFQQRDGTIAIRLGSVVDLLRDRYDASELDRFSQAGAMGAFVTLAQLQAAGIPISYDPVYDEVGFGIDYDDAPQANKVQIDQIGVQSVGSDRALIDQIPR